MEQMSLSQAIRLGSMLKPKGRQGWMDAKSSCALAAASEAIGVPGVRELDYASGTIRWTVDYTELGKRFPILNETVQGPAVLTGDRVERGCLLTAIWMINDTTDMTREQIADWVEGIEAQQPAAAETPQPELVSA